MLTNGFQTRSPLRGYKSLSERVLDVGKRLANKSTHVDNVRESTVSKPYHMWLDSFMPLGYDLTKRRDWPPAETL